MRHLPLPLPVDLFPPTASADAFWHMHDGGYGYGYGLGMVFVPVIWIVVLGLVVAGVIWFIRLQDGGNRRAARSDALVELDLRLARGEIDIEEHAAKKKALSA